MTRTFGFAHFLLPRSLAAALLLVPLASACVIVTDDDEEDCRGESCEPVDQTCNDPKYADGMCHPELSCAVPDIDCFTTFDADAEARVWFTDFEQQLAAQQGRAPRVQLPASDPRFAQARALLDRGWEAFREHRPVGRLGDERPALVVLDDPDVNAFVIPDHATGRSAFLVMVHTGALSAGASDDAMLGLMMHELQHAVGLHLIPGGQDRMRTFYVADGDEPIGHEQDDDARARGPGEAWRAAAVEVGPFSAAELGGLSIVGELDRILLTVAARGTQTNPAGCAQPVARLEQIRGEVLGAVDELDGSLVLDLSGYPARVDQVLRGLREQCVPDLTASFYQVVAAIAGNGTTPAQIEAMMPPADRALVAGKHVLDGVSGLVANRRAAMRAAEARFAADTGQPWEQLRYFSYEEDADDVTVPVLRAAGLDPRGQADFLLLALPPDARARCKVELDAGRVPAYGVDLTDEHHATCWRAHHVEVLAADKDRARRVRPARTQRAAGAGAPARRLLPPLLSDLVMH